MTFSIVGYDPAGPAWGVAIASRFLAVGARSLWGESDVGIVAVQANHSAANGAAALALLRQGVPAHDVIPQLMASDFNARRRQMAVIDRDGGVATYTGPDCNDWKGGLVGRSAAAQGNSLLGPAGCRAMLDRFEASAGDLGRRLVDALAVCDAVAGDRRGRQSAALLVVRPATEPPLNILSDPTIDLRVDDHPEPFAELSRLLDLHDLLYTQTAPGEELPQDPPTIRRVQEVLRALGLTATVPAAVELDDEDEAALLIAIRNNNLGRRATAQGWPDRRALEHLEQRARLARATRGRPDHD